MIIKDDKYEIVREYNLRKSWFSERAKMFSKLSEENAMLINDVQFQLTNLEEGNLDLFMYVDGVKKTRMLLSSDSYPLPKIRKWLEQIVDDRMQIASVRIDNDNLHTVLCYEHLCPAEIGWSKDDEDFDADSCYDIGLFYLYSIGSGSIEIYAICKTKDFINNMYMTFLCFSGFEGNNPKSSLNFTMDWYYDSELGYMGYWGKGRLWESIKDEVAARWNNWTFYEEIKSPLLEWNYISKEPYKYRFPQFKDHTRVTEMIQMWAEWGDALFWECGGCCGDCTIIHTDDGDIDISGIEGLKEWYEEFNSSNPCVAWSEDKQKNWNERGWYFALKIRELLPDNIDLCYYWLPTKHKIESVRTPMRLVPNRHCWIENYRQKQK